MKWLKRLEERFKAPFKRNNPGLSRVEWEIVRELKKGPRPVHKIIERVDAAKRTVFLGLKLLRERGIIGRRGEIYELKQFAMGIDEVMWIVSLFFMLVAATIGSIPLAIFSGFVFLVSLLRTRRRK